MKQITNHLLMVRPANFGYNPETATNNAFQNADADIASPSSKAIVEFDAFVEKLRLAGVDVTVVQDTTSPVKPDCVFPNNWVSFHQGGRVVQYPMFAKNRRLERDNGVLDIIKDKFKIVEHMSYVDSEENGVFLEGTGSLILDRVNKVVYACRSLRTDEDLLNKWCKEQGYTKVVFDAKDEDDGLIYHTNVMMALGVNFCVICLDSIHDINERENVIDILEDTEKEIIEISYDQMNQFAGNMLEVKGKNGSVLVMSKAAFDSLDEFQIETIEQHSSILYSDLTTIETLGGGSARCMMAEIFLDLK